MPCRFEVKPIKINFFQKSSTFHLSIMQVFFPLFQPQFNLLILRASCYIKNINLTTWVLFKDRVMWVWTFVVGGTLHIPLIFISLSDFRHFLYHFTMFSRSISPKNLRYPPNPRKEKTKREKIFTQRLPLSEFFLCIFGPLLSLQRLSRGFFFLFFFFNCITQLCERKMKSTIDVCPTHGARACPEP